MKRITKKAVSLFLALCLMVSCGTAAMAARTDVRQTSFFRHDLYHTDQDFSEFEYKHIEAEPILEKIKSIRDLLDDAANAAQVERMFWEVDDQLLEMMTMQGLLIVRAYLDVNDEESADQLAYVEQALETLQDAEFALARDILNSPCAAFLKEALNEDQVKKYLEYGEMDPDTLALTAREGELRAKAATLLAKTYTAGYDAAEWTLNSVDEALSSGKITQESADAIWMSIRAAKNAELGNLYLEMLSVRNEIAKAKGYNSYPEYSYKETHLRDYTPDEASKLYADIKEYIVPLYKNVEALYRVYEDENPDVFNHDYVGAGDSFLDLLEPYIARISSEMQESFTYMREHHLYDIGFSDSKLPVSFSVPIQTYGAPFYYQSPNGALGDFSTAVHEFGHYNNTYYDCFDTNQHYVTFQDDCTDTSEVHSQGFELIFSHFYPEVFGKDANIVDISLHYSLLKAILLGALYDEFQQYAYTTKNVTLEQLNKKYSELVEAYGVPPTAREGGLYHWVDISHTFLQPCYYISYATSAAGAYTFWNAGQNDYFGAVDKYLRFVALGPDTGFQRSFKAVGMTNPLSDGYLKGLSETLYEKLELPGETDDSIPQYFTLMAGGKELDINQFSTMSYADAEAITYVVDYNADGVTVPVLASVEDPADSVVIGYPVVDGVPVYDEESHTGANAFVDVTPENTIDNPVYVTVKYIPNKEGVVEAKPYDQFYKIALYMAPAGPVSVSPTNDKLEVDGKAQSPAAYKINDYNYFKLRDIAVLLNGTGKQFSVDYDASTGNVTITSGQPYAATDSDLAALPVESRQATASTNVIYINGASAQLTAYNIDGFNYFKLRDLASALDFYVGWTAERGMFLESDRPYSAWEN